MNLDEAQRRQVAQWVEQGLKLSEIQDRLAAELGLRLTYMEVRLLVDDLRLTPKDAERPKPGAVTLPGPAASAPANPAARPAPTPPGAVPAKSAGVSVTVDQVARPGTMVSGKVTFSDGNSADWYFDQMGRLGLVPQKPGYRPPAADMQQFQMSLESELSKLGF